MAVRKKGGSIIYKILIGILIVGLSLSLFLPRHIWNMESKMEEECHLGIVNVWTAETFYKQKTGSYTSSIDTLVSVLKSDENIIAILDTIYTHSLFPGKETLDVIHKMPVDSLGTCPETGLEYYIFLSDSIPVIRIKCPNVEMMKPAYLVFKKKISNHGSISDGKVSWE